MRWTGWDVVDGDVCGWSLSPCAMGQGLRTCPQMRDGWQHDCAQVSRLHLQLPYVPPPLEKSLGLFLSLCFTSFTWMTFQFLSSYLLVLGSSLHPESASSMTSQPLSVQDWPRSLWMTHRGSGIGNAGPACAPKMPEPIPTWTFFSPSCTSSLLSPMLAAANINGRWSPVYLYV